MNINFLSMSHRLCVVLFILSADKLTDIGFLRVLRLFEYSPNYDHEKNKQKDECDHVSVESRKVDLNLRFSYTVVCNRLIVTIEEELNPFKPLLFYRILVIIKNDEQ